MTLKKAFNIKPGEVISLVGGGGKTTLMFALAWELASSGNCVTTTTTRILEPLPSETPFLLVELSGLQTCNSNAVSGVLSTAKELPMGLFHPSR